MLSIQAPVTRLSSFYELVLSGGPVMVPLGICSVAALAFGAERLFALRQRRLGTRGFAEGLRGALRGGQSPGARERARALCAESGTPLARVIAAALERAHEGPAQAEKAAEDAGARELASLHSSLRPLVAIAAIAPLLGLLGTVWGIILAFGDIGGSDALGRPDVLAASISQALVTTATGLVIAIPVHVLYHWLRARVDRFARETEAAYELLRAELFGLRASHELAPGAPPAPPAFPAAGAAVPEPAS
jgi:biopolymer transport protein ExbB